MKKEATKQFKQYFGNTLIILQKGNPTNKNKENSGRRRTVRSKKNIERVRNMLENNTGKIFARKIA